MILRSKKINLNSKEIMIKISYGEPDVRKLIKQFAKMVTHEWPGRVYQCINTPSLTEGDVTYTLFHAPQFFGGFPDDFKEQLVAWVWASALRLKLFKPSATDPTHFYMAADCFKHPGRPKKADDE